MSYYALTRVWNYALMLVLLLSFFPGAPQAAKAPALPVAAVTVTPTVVHWHPHVAYSRLTLTVSASDGQVYQQEFASDEPVEFFAVDDTGAPLPDGLCTYELRVIPAFDKAVQAALAAARAVEDTALSRPLQHRGLVPREPLTQSGYFTISGGGILSPNITETN